jgi:hypothetical protein
MPGSMVDEDKVEMFEGMYDRLAVEDPPKYRFLCGDLNSPKSESSDGAVTVWGSDDRWIDAERSVLVDLAEYDLADAYRAVNGYGYDAYSYVDVNNGTESRRRFDHAFSSERLNPVAAEYLHQYDDLSDHTALAVVFKPRDGLKEDADSIERESTHSDDAGTRAGGERTGSRSNYPGLDYDVDQRMVDSDENHRLGRFKTGWNRANDGAELDAVLDELTWQNLGWRFGRLLGPASEDIQENFYQWCVQQQLEAE